MSDAPSPPDSSPAGSGARRGVDPGQTPNEPPSETSNRSRARRFGRWTVSLLPIVAVAAVGAFVAIALFGSTTASIGPFDTTMTATPFGGRGTQVELAPLGQIGVDSHRGPLGLTIELDQLREADARAIAEDPESFTLDESALTDEVRDGITDLGRRVVVASTIGGIVLSVLARRRWQSAVAGGLVGLLVAGGSMGAAAATWEPDALAEPRYSGLLSLAPQAVGDARDVVDRFADYQAQLAGLIENVAVLY